MVKKLAHMSDFQPFLVNKLCAQDFVYTGMVTMSSDYDWFKVCM
jgi:hypothetical protein